MAQAVETQLVEREEILSRDPNSGEVLGAAPVISEADVRAAVAGARQAQRGWAARSLAERIRALRRVQEALVDQAGDLARLVSREMGKGVAESLIADVLLTLNTLDGYLRLAPRALRPRRIRHGLLHATKRSYVVYEPAGVVAVISPFNFPILLSMQPAFAALIAGNAVVHKPSEFAPLSALRVAEILGAAGLPPDLFRVVTGYAETGRALIDAGVDHVSFVGSSRTGRAIGAAAGERLIPATLELGGNSAMIVLDDAPLARAVDGALTYAFAANGQMCGAVTRVYVHEAVADEFMARIEARAAAWRASTDVRPGRSEVTALVSEAAAEKVERHVGEALAGGARAVVGGARLEGTDAPVYLPTLLTGARPEMVVMREETFGPVLSLARVRDDDEAVELANDSAYGLTASVWTRDSRRAWEIARRLEAGTVAVNDHLWPFFAPDVPWGGVKASGVGRVGGEWGLREVTRPKVVSYDRLVLPREFYWHPAQAWVHDVIQALVPLLFSRRLSRRARALGDLSKAVAVRLLRR